MYIARDSYSFDIHRLIRENYRQVFFNKEIIGTLLPFHLEREFKKYFICENLAFARAGFTASYVRKTSDDKERCLPCVETLASDIDVTVYN